MYLANRPVFYTDGVNQVEAHYTAQARDLEALGWKKVEKVVIEVSEPVAQVKEVAKPEVDGEAILQETDLHTLTKAELVSYAHEMNIELRAGANKSEILETIENNSND